MTEDYLMDNASWVLPDHVPRRWTTDAERQALYDAVVRRVVFHPGRVVYGTGKPRDE